MEYQIVSRPAFRIVGLRTPLPTDAEEGFLLVPKFWGEAGPHIPELYPLMNSDIPGVLGVSTCHREQDNYYYIAVATQEPAPEGMWAEESPACTWAVFSGIGPMPEAMQSLQKRIVAEWLPESGYEWAQAPDIEVYLSARDAEEPAFQVWLPVAKKG